jgi:hypothetical protein
MEKSNRNKNAGEPRPSPRESDNPIVEEYKEELLRKSTYSPHSVSQLLSEEERLAHLEDMLSDIKCRIDDIERRINDLECKMT